MKDRLIRTPLPPFQTFNDDPLRVLRLIRFSSRLNFAIVDEAKAAMKDPEIKVNLPITQPITRFNILQKALRLKISRERVGIELQKMLQGRHPHIALKLIDTLDLYDAIFTPPIEFPPTLPSEHMPIAADIVSHIIAASTKKSYANLRACADSPHDQYVAWLIAAVAPWKGYMFEGKDTAKRIPGAATALRDGLRMVTKIYNTIVSSYRNYEMIQQTAGRGPEMSRSQLGMFVRKLGADWRSQVLCALVLEAIPVWKTGEQPTDEAKALLEKYSALMTRIKQLELEEAFSFKTILNVSNLTMATWPRLTFAGHRGSGIAGAKEGGQLDDGCHERPHGVAARE